MSDIAIQVQHLSKQYKIGVARRRHNTLRDQLSHSFRSLFQRKNSDGEDRMFWALKDVSFDVKTGDVVGVIGGNGAGKSTLLKILSRITQPTEGKATIYGRVGSLLEVGTGFHAELTGRENIYLNGAILGMKKAEIQRKFDEIVSFSEIEKFIDTPVKHYSSGMYVRLAFAVAAHLEPEVLIVDEVLAVGDTAFQKKCLGKMEGVAQDGRTVLFVSHNMSAVQHLCNRVLMLEHGKVLFSGSAKDGIEHYLRSISTDGRNSRSHIIDLRSLTRPRRSTPLLQQLELFADGKPMNGPFKIGASFRAHIKFRLQKPTSLFDVSLGFNNHLGNRIFTASTMYQPNQSKFIGAGEHAIVCEIPNLPFAPGDYRVKVMLECGPIRDRLEDVARFTIVDSDYYGTGRVPSDCVFVLDHQWHFLNRDQISFADEVVKAGDGH